MAKHTPAPAPVHPAVRFERTDITANGVVKFGLYLSTGVGLVVVSMLWYGDVLIRQHRKLDALALPPASTDADRRLPEPRLEALEDLRENKPRMFPPRAAEYYAPPLERLKTGDEDKGILKIEVAMGAVSKSLPVRKTGDNAAPTSFSRRLPSKASSGKSETGGR